MLDRETKSSYNLIVTARDCAKEFPMMYDDHSDDYDEESDGDASEGYDGTTSVQQQRNQLRTHPSMLYNLPRQRRQYLQYQQQNQQQIAGGTGSVQEPQQRLSSTVQVSIEFFFYPLILQDIWFLLLIILFRSYVAEYVSMRILLPYKSISNYCLNTRCIYKRFLRIFLFT